MLRENVITLIETGHAGFADYRETSGVEFSEGSTRPWPDASTKGAFASSDRSGNGFLVMSSSQLAVVS